MDATLQLGSVRSAPDFAWHMRLKVLAAGVSSPHHGSSNVDI